jgi:hypothetical protein
MGSLLDPVAPTGRNRDGDQEASRCPCQGKARVGRATKKRGKSTKGY